MASLIQSSDYPASVFPTAEIEAEVAALTVAYERRMWALEQIGFTQMSAWNGSMHEYVNRHKSKHN